MFQVTDIQRVNSDTVKVTVTMNALEFCKAKKQGLGFLYGVDISNHCFRQYGIKACNPTVGDRERAIRGVKTITLYYTDTQWNEVNNVVRVDFTKKKLIA